MARSHAAHPQGVKRPWDRGPGSEAEAAAPEGPKGKKGYGGKGFGEAGWGFADQEPSKGCGKGFGADGPSSFGKDGAGGCGKDGGFGKDGGYGKDGSCGKAGGYGKDGGFGKDAGFGKGGPEKGSGGKDSGFGVHSGEGGVLAEAPKPAFSKMAAMPDLSGQDDVGKGDAGKGDKGCGNGAMAKGDAGKGDKGWGKGDMVKGDVAKGDKGYGKGAMAKGDANKGDKGWGKGDMFKGDTGKGEMGCGSADMAMGGKGDMVTGDQGERGKGGKASWQPPVKAPPWAQPEALRPPPKEGQEPSPMEPEMATPSPHLPEPQAKAEQAVSRKDLSDRWTARAVLFHLGDGAWSCLTPDMEITRHNLNTLRQYALDRNSSFPHWALAGVYAFDPAGPGELAEMKRQARQRAALLGAGGALEEEATVWVISDPRGARFGQVLDEQAIDNPNRCVHMRSMGVISLDGVERLIAKLHREERGDWLRDQRERGVDIRTIGGHRSRLGRRDVAFGDAVEMMEQVELADAPDFGPRAMGEFFSSVATGSGNLASYQAELERLSGVFAGGARNHEHRILLESIRRAICLDQLNAKNLHCMGAAARRIIQIEMAAQRNPRHPDFSGLDDVVAEHILKQTRLREEELDRDRPTGDRDKRQKGDKEKKEKGDNNGGKDEASYDVTQLRVCKGDIHPVPVAELLPAEAAGFLRHFQSQIELAEPEVADRVREAGGLPEPYWGPLLRGDAEVRRVFVLFCRFAKIGIAGFGRAINSRCGAFSVRQEDGNIRFVFDAREMWSWFGFDSTLRFEDWGLGLHRIWDDSIGGWTLAVAEEMLRPCLRVLPMVWAWALYFAQEVVSNQVRASCLDGDRQLLRDKRPAPLLRPGKPLAAVYAFQARAAVAGLGLRAADIAVQELESMGLSRRGSDRRPCLLSILQEVCHFIGGGSRRRAALPPLVRGELRMAAVACFLSEVDLGAPLSDEVDALMYGRMPLRAVWDAHRWRGRWRFVEVEANARTRVYTTAYINQLRGVTDGFGSTLAEGAAKGKLGELPFRRAGWARGEGPPRGRGAGRPGQRREVELLNVVPALPTDLTDAEGWAAAVEGRWRYNEHITKAAAYSIGCRMRWRARHVPTDLSVADAGSRRRQAPDPEWTSQKKRERQLVVHWIAAEFVTYVVPELRDVSGWSLRSLHRNWFGSVSGVQWAGASRTQWRQAFGAFLLRGVARVFEGLNGRGPLKLGDVPAAGEAASRDAACGAADAYLAQHGALFGRTGAAERARLRRRGDALGPPVAPPPGLG
ncbi:unnamed protein product [Prorocentrum cordatum]|uniref:Uncharacterized protein n=1 Tax=Prorocentrum cordatum TaxID=2364126 RepID=A0ABN9SBE1_9DINO|nr:unnamed protein product [Polarella glacialis]